jgi:hypothetical protein
MTRTKMLAATIILSAAVATPVLAQDAGKRSQSRYGMDARSIPRSAYNQVSTSPSAGAANRDRWSPENSGTADKDPQITGGEDITRRAPGL